MKTDLKQPENPESAWHLKLYSKSLHKQRKLKEIQKLLGSTHDRNCIDMGGDNGVISFLLRKNGGTWMSIDISEKAVRSIGNLVGDEQAYLMREGKLPQDDASVDVVVIIDMLEHVEADDLLVKECHRVLKQQGTLIANVPHVKKFSVIRGLRKLLGLTDEMHGHVRPGYTQNQLYELLKDGFDITDSNDYNKFFVELVDTGVQFVGSFLRGAGEEVEDVSKGNMIDEEDFEKYKKIFRFYSFVYPALWLASKLDLLLPFTRGHSLIVKARSRPWKPRRSVTLRDGRSISEATIQTKIGTAAPF